MKTTPSPRAEGEAVGTDTRATTTATDQAPRRRWRTAGVLAIGVLLGALLSGVGAVWATHQFSDVPDSSPFHGDIDWLADNGIAQGFDDGTFRPTDPVSRQAFAAFLRRYNAGIQLVQSSYQPDPSSSFLLSAACPTGSRPVGGAGETSALNLVMTDSYPHNDSWRVRWEFKDNQSASPGVVRVYATCVPK